MNPVQKKPPSLDGDRMKIEYHGRHGVLHVTATFPISKLDGFAAQVSERKLQFEREGVKPGCSSDVHGTESDTSSPNVFTFPESSAIPGPGIFGGEVKSLFEEPPRVVTINLGDIK